MCSRKLVRSVSTCSEDILDEALNELSLLNQRHALRQQWLRKNMKTCPKYRPSGSVCSTSSLSSNSSSSLSSSFSSQTSATHSSTESWDSFSDSSEHSSMSSSVDYPRVVRRLSKPKLNMYRPYCKPRRFSLQLVSHPESPEITDDLSNDSAINQSSVKHSSCSTIGPIGRSLTPPKYSRLMSEKENFSSQSSSSGIKVKSNPTSPSKSDLSSVLLDANLMQFNAINERLLSTTTNMCSSLLPQQLSTTGVLLLRSKSLDDLTSCLGPNSNYQLNCSSTLFPKQSPAMAAAQSCDIDNVLQRISTLQV